MSSEFYLHLFPYIECNILHCSCEFLIDKPSFTFTNTEQGCCQPIRAQCNRNIKILTEYEYEYIRNGKFQRIRISNIFVLSKLVEYEYRIYSFLANGRI